MIIRDFYDFCSLYNVELYLLVHLKCNRHILFSILLDYWDNRYPNIYDFQITGTGHGIGRELCFQFAPHGCVVVCLDIDAKGNEETVRLLAQRGYNKRIHSYT